MSIPSYIKNIVIPLHDFYYHHGSSDDSTIKRRFLGREKIKEKLKSVLMHNETKSGAYLVTGYRGMGKTTFVNQVIDEISTVQKSIKITEKILRIITLLFFLRLIIQLNNIDLNFAFFISLVICMVFGRVVLKQQTFTIHALFKFHLIDKPINNKQYFRILHDIYFLFLIASFSLLFEMIASSFIDFNYYEWFFEVSLVIFILLGVTYKFLTKKKGSGFVRSTFQELYDRMVKYFAYYHQMSIKINLGFDDLKEIDVLRLVSSHLKTNYTSFIKITRRNYLWKLLNFAIVLILTFSLFKTEGFSSFHSSLSDRLLIWYIFPSQIDENSLKVTKEVFLSKIFNDMDDFENILRKDTKFDTVLSERKESFLLHSYHKVSIVTHYLDFMFYQSVKGLNKNLLLLKGWNINLNYLFLIYLLSFYLLINRGLAIAVFGGITHKKVFKSIQNLNDKIESQLTHERSIELNTAILPIKNASMNFGKRTKKYPIADVREIEKELLDIFEEIDSIPRHTVRPRFIFIFDELDKIEPKENDEKDNNEDHPELNFSTESSFLINPTRQRQQTIVKILSNLKHFLTTAKARFIFIAGRELYDASLADVSDRNFFIGSIFNEIIYVDSFLKDSLKTSASDIAGFIEDYVCYFLIPDSERKEDKIYNLRDYKDYLRKFKDRKFTDLEILKTIHELTNFITYLTYRSNGAPKKCISNFEKYVHPQKAYDEKLYTIIGDTNNNNNHYLVFQYYDQYTFGIISYLVNPFFNTINQYIKVFGDKLLVSLTFFLDHLYKYHNHGFSWEDLETSPEILEINKAPQQRELISIIVNYLSNVHLEHTESGLFNYKFNKRISDEINYLCKINEQESAAFNFSLDESLLIKKHFSLVLSHMQSKYKDYSSNASPDFVRSLNYVHTILGDIYYYDGEYDNAIIEYLESVQLFGENKFDKLSIELQMLLIKSTLKLGLVYEKKKNYDSAMILYGKLVSRIMKFKNVVAKDIYETEDEYSLPNELVKSELQDLTNWNLRKDRIAYKFSLIEKLRLISLPLLAKLQILEKATVDGITSMDIQLIEKEYEFLNTEVISNEKPILYIEMFNKMGDILFFKNGLIGTSKSSCNECSSTICNIFFNDNQQMLQHYHPCSSCQKYYKSFDKLYKTYINQKIDKNFLLHLLKYIDRGSNNELSISLLKTTANLLSDIGNVFLSCSSIKQTIDKKFILNLLDLFQDTTSYNLIAEKYFSFNPVGLKVDTHSVLPNNKLSLAIYFYYLSGCYYRRAMNYKEYGYQLLKILYVLKELFSIKSFADQMGGKDKSKIIKALKKGIVKKAIRAYYRSYDNSHQIEISEIEQLLMNLNVPETLSTISLMWEIEEIIIITKMITNFLGVNAEQNDTQRASRSIYSMYNRTLEYEYFAKENRSKFSKKDINKNELILDSIFCLIQLIKSCEISGISYDVNHSFIASAYEELGFWCEELEELEEVDKVKIVEELENTSDKGISSLLRKQYNYESALHHYRMALDTHRNGIAYKQIIETMIFLNDDYNDNFYHFCASLERYRINSKIHNKIDDVRIKLRNLDESDSIYDYDKYL